MINRYILIIYIWLINNYEISLQNVRNVQNNNNFKKMSQLRISTKPTLDEILNQSSNDKLYKSVQRIQFPLIKTNLKKTQITKYHSAFLNPKKFQDISVDEIKFKMAQVKKLNTQNINTQQKSLKKKVWKLNKKRNQSYFVADRSQQLNNRNQSRQNNCDQSQQLNNCDRSQHMYVSNQKQLTQQTGISPERSRVHKRDDIKNPQIFSLMTEPKNRHTESIESQTYRFDYPQRRSNQEINANIVHSNKIISFIKQNKSNLKFNTVNSDQTVSLQQLQDKFGLFSYLKRNFVTNRQKLTTDKIKDYFKSPRSSQLVDKINYQSRKFLQEKVKKDYHGYREVQQLKQEMSLKRIGQQIQIKKQQFHKQYFSKQNNPYLSFLSLPRQLKHRVLQNLTQK